MEKSDYYFMLAVVLIAPQLGENFAWFASGVFLIISLIFEFYLEKED